MGLVHRESFDDVRIINGAWRADISEAVTSADMSLTISETSQLTITVDDPGLAFLKKNKVPLNSWVEYDGLKFGVAGISTHEGSGEGGFSLTCRPRVIRALKERKGKKTYKNVSPSTFVALECKAVKAKYTIQKSARRSSISRDVAEKGSDQEANSWTTFQRLAQDLAYELFEYQGRVYFGQAAWIAKQINMYARVEWGTSDNGAKMTNFPECDKSLDNDGILSISFEVPIERRKQFQPGSVVDFTGVPGFGAYYVVTTMEFPLAGPGELSIQAQTVKGLSRPKNHK